MTQNSLTSETARSGHEVLKKNGKWLASSIDPVREAQQWCEAALEVAGGNETIVVLGLACGYHVSELVSRRPGTAVLIIDCDRRVSEKALEICPKLSGQAIVVEPDWTKLLDHSMVRDAVGGTYRVLKHPPSFSVEPEFFASVDTLLLGRDKLSFLRLLKARPEILSLLDSSLLADAQAFRDEAVSIKSLQKIFTQRPNTSRERRLWRVLEELVL